MNTVELRFKVTGLSGERAQVEMEALSDVTLREIGLVAQYIMWIYAKESELPFEEAMRSVCEGAREFKGVRKISVLPEGQTE